jgi:membrane protein
MPALLMSVIAAAGFVAGYDTVRERVLGEFGGVAGGRGVSVVEAVLVHLDPTRRISSFSQVAGLAALVFGATGFLAQLHDALNTMWGARTRSKRRGFWATLVKRVFSMGMVLTLTVLLVLSLGLSTAAAVIAERLFGASDPASATALATFVQIAFSVALGTVLFAAVFKTMPDADVEWREVWVGAAVTSGLLTAGQFAVGLYLRRVDTGASYGAMGPLAVLLVWLYLSSLIVLTGAEFTQVYARTVGPRHKERTARMRQAVDHDPEIPAAKRPPARG